MRKPRFFQIDEVKLPRSKWVRHVISNYVQWVETFGYVFCAVVVIGIAFCFFYKVDEVAKEKAADVGKTAVKPREEVLKHTGEAVVTRVFVEDFARVRKGQVLANICDEGLFVVRRKAAQHSEEVLKSMDEMADLGPLPAWAAGARARAQAERDAWRIASRDGTRVTLAAPADGEVVGAKDLAGKVIKAGDPILKVVDLNELRFNVLLMGTNAERVRVGQKVKIEVQPNYGKQTWLRGDVRLSYFDRRRFQFNDILDTKETKDLLTEHWKDKQLTTKDDRKEDLALPATEVSEIEIFSARLRTNRLPGASAGGEVMSVEPLKDLELEGEIIEGTHGATFRTSEMTPELRKKLEERLAAKLKGKNLEPQLLPTGLRRWWLEKVRRQEVQPSPVPLHVNSVERLNLFIKVKAKLPEPKLDDPDFEKKMEKHLEDVAKKVGGAMETEKVDRSYEAVVVLKNPPAILQQKMRELMQLDPPVTLTAKVEAVVGKRRVAMLLFRQ